MHFYDIKLATERVKYQVPVSRFIRRRALLSKSKAELQNVSEGCTSYGLAVRIVPVVLHRAWRWRTRLHVGPEGADLQVGLQRLFEGRVLVERFEVVLYPRFFPL
jgi:hypothetical protein